jgi:hypothetical protein
MSKKFLIIRGDVLLEDNSAPRAQSLRERRELIELLRQIKRKKIGSIFVVDNMDQFYHIETLITQAYEPKLVDLQEWQKKLSLLAMEQITRQSKPIEEAYVIYQREKDFLLFEPEKKMHFLRLDKKNEHPQGWPYRTIPSALDTLAILEEETAEKQLVPKKLEEAVC